jgi:hypothetical protein
MIVIFFDDADEGGGTLAESERKEEDFFSINIFKIRYLFSCFSLTHNPKWDTK